MQARQHPQHFGLACIHPDRRADRIENVDGFGLAQLPGARDEGVRLGCQCANRAQVDHIGAEFGIERFFKISRDFGMFPTPEHPEFRNPGNFGGETDTTGAVDATGHDRFDQRAHMLVFDRALVLFEP